MILDRRKISAVLNYIFLFISLSYGFTSYFRIELLRFIQIVIILMMALAQDKHIINKKATVVFLLLLLNQIVTMVLKSSHDGLDFAQISAVLVALLYSSSVEWSLFKTGYVNFMAFISSYSLVTWALYQAAPSVFYNLPKVQASALTANTFFSLVPLKMDDYYRNFGCFQEPGVYQIFLCIAIIIVLFGGVFSIKKLILFYATVITTLSTAGYIVAVGILVAYFCNKSMESEEKKVRKNLFWGVVGITVVGIYMYIGGYASIDEHVFSKFNDLSIGSGFERFRAVAMAANTFFNNLFLGCGYGRWSQLYLRNGILTCTPLNWFAIFGILYGIITNGGLILFAHKMANSIQGTIMLLLCILMMIFSQDMVGNIIVLSLIFYAYSVPKENVRIVAGG